MSGRDKIDAAVEYLITRKFYPNTAAPPLWRLCWRIGFLMPPPHFLGFLPIALLTGLPFGLLICGPLVAFLALMGTAPDWPMAAMGVGGAVFFGTAMGAYYRWSARRLGLPPWSEFGADFDTPDDTW